MSLPPLGAQDLSRASSHLVPPSVAPRGSLSEFSDAWWKLQASETNPKSQNITPSTGTAGRQEQRNWSSPFRDRAEARDPIRQVTPHFYKLTQVMVQSNHVADSPPPPPPPNARITPNVSLLSTPSPLPLFFFFFSVFLGIWRFPGWGWNQSYSYWPTPKPQQHGILTE